MSSAGLLAQTRNTRPNILFAIADDMSWAHTAVAGDPVVKTPAIDAVAREGVRFTNAYCCSPSCTPSRAAALTGQHIWRLKESGNLWSTLRKAEYPVYPDLLEAAGYQVGLMRKGWGPGDFRPGGFTRNPAGPNFASFEEFLGRVPDAKPFCFWFGTSDPHRPYEKGSGIASCMNPKNVRVPDFLPDSPEVRSDICDYLFEIQRFDREVGQAMDLLRKAGRLDNTLLVITGDNGMPFPRGKTNLYDYGVRMPLYVQWPRRVKGGRVITDFINSVDYAPAFLEAAGLKPGRQMTGRSFLSILTSGRSGRVDSGRDFTVFGRERHTARAASGLGYPMRAIRTDDYLYIRNYEPERLPEGNPPAFADIDDGPAKAYLLAHREEPAVKRLFDLSCGRRPPEELYDVREDPYQMRNVAGEQRYSPVKDKLRDRLRQRLVATADPRETGGEILWDNYPYTGKL
jgi:arylsulfatase A-like enzyme